MSDKPEDDERIGEKIECALLDEPELGSSFPEWRQVWETVLKQAKHTPPKHIRGWIPVYQPDNHDQSGEIMRVQRINELIFGLATIDNGRADADEVYWRNVDDRYNRIRLERGEQPLEMRPYTDENAKTEE